MLGMTNLELIFGKEGLTRILAQICFRRSGQSSRSTDPRLAPSILEGRVPEHSNVVYHTDGSVNVRPTLTAYLSDKLAPEARDEIEEILRDPEERRVRSTWDAMFDQYEAELIEMSLEDVIDKGGDDVAEAKATLDYLRRGGSLVDVDPDDLEQGNVSVNPSVGAKGQTGPIRPARSRR